MRRTFLIVIFSLSLTTPLLASAQSTNPLLGPLVQCNGAAGFDSNNKPLKVCQLCDAVQLAQTILNFLVAVAAFIAVMIFCYAGFLMLTAGGEMGKVTQARAMFTNVATGLVIVLAGWLIIDTVMKYAFQGKTEGEPGSDLYNAMVDFGPWNQINCVAQVPQKDTKTAQVPTGGVNPVVQSTGDTGNTGDIQNNIAVAASAYRGTDTSAGPDGGNKACAWAVNHVLNNAGIASIDGNAVRGMEATLQGGRGIPVDQSVAQAGDIIIQGESKHVGVCQNAGCTTVISNSSSNASFTNVQSNSAFSRGAQSRIYQVATRTATNFLTPSHLSQLTPHEQNRQFSAAVSAASLPDARSKEAVLNTLQNKIPPGDSTLLYTTVISGDYALQSWGDGSIGGEAFLKYDSTSAQWNLVTWGGGTWNVSELMQFEEVPQDIATTLVAGMPR